MKEEEIQVLFKKYHEGKCTEEEKALLEGWFLQFNEHDVDISPRRIKAIEDRLFRELPGNEFKFIEIGLKLLAAVALLGIVAAIALKLSIPGSITKPILTAANIHPGSNVAVLTLSSGKKIDLKNTSNGQISNQGGSTVAKAADGQLVYNKSATAIIDTVSNTVATPYGGQYQITLPDGSKVWLNSAASLKYPTSFTGKKERIVLMTGEAYFEIVKDKSHPFIVQTGNQTVKVFGTHFNINAYPDEPGIKTTLAEGSVTVCLAGGLPRTIVPGQQAVLAANQLTISNGNVEEALAWKNGYFRFNDEKIESVMRELARWYKIEVQYQSIPTDGLNGKISRYKNIDQVLRALEATKTVHFKIEGRRVTVMK